MFPSACNLFPFTKLGGNRFRSGKWLGAVPPKASATVSQVARRLDDSDQAVNPAQASMEEGRPPFRASFDRQHRLAAMQLDVPGYPSHHRSTTPVPQCDDVASNGVVRTRCEDQHHASPQVKRWLRFLDGDAVLFIGRIALATRLPTRRLRVQWQGRSSLIRPTRTSRTDSRRRS